MAQFSSKNKCLEPVLRFSKAVFHNLYAHRKEYFRNMAELKKPRREHSRFTIQFEVNDEEEARLSSLKERIALSKGFLKADTNIEWMERLLTFVEMDSCHQHSLPSTISSSSKSHFVSPLPLLCSPPSPATVACQQRVEIHTALKDNDGKYFLAGKATICRLVKCLSGSGGKCPSCHGCLLLETMAMERRGHAARITVHCEQNHHLVWFSSPIMSSKYVVNLK